MIHYELSQMADHPALSPKSGDPEWWVAMVGEFGGFWLTTWKTRHLTWRVGDAMHVAWLGSAPSPHKGIPPVLTILLCSLKLHDIWVMLLM
jgi:hypothetical protein